ncbi:hypothetical protein ACETIH_16675 [Microvirga arabica]|uniref:Kazal-like domain-containing protein n=3 Tax=Microvirga TaxID=186650 RepID=A0ABW9Z2Y4_9HYPH|nr:hypothetical protein [Microvirga arsenatis]
MNSVWTHVRRLATSLMLVAMAAFALHSGALAGIKVHNTVSHHAEGRIHTGVSQPSHHESGEGVALVKASDSCTHCLNSGEPDGAGTTYGSHCANACGVALPFGVPGEPARTATAGIQALVSQGGAGIDPAGLKRPPRTSFIV